MTPAQQAHLEDLKADFDTRVTSKYTKGVQEHGGNLWEQSTEWMLQQAIDEAIDQVVYLLTLQSQLEGQDGN